MGIKKLVAQEFRVEEGQVIKYKEGYTYTYLVDPETGIYYEPIEGWEVTGENLESLFREVPPAEDVEEVDNGKNS